MPEGHQQPDRLRILELKVAALESAFPEHDSTGEPDYIDHHENHRLWRESQRERADFYKQLRFDLYKWGIIGAITITLGLLVIGLLVKIGAYHAAGISPDIIRPGK